MLAERDAAATRRIDELVATLGDDLAAASQGRAVAAEEAVEAQANEALDLAERIFPDEWKDAGAAADFDVIRTSLDRVVGAVRAGEYGKAEQARLEAYAFFEFGPEQRLRGLAPDLFARTEGLFWYGADGFPGLAQLIRRKARRRGGRRRRARRSTRRSPTRRRRSAPARPPPRRSSPTPRSSSSARGSRPC